ncbi:MAG: UDP-N-acetylmuramoyl-L-alanine--D-glutamate ligase, partial [Pseudomonadota bacterium]
PKAGGMTSLVPLLDRVERTYLIGEAATGFAEDLGEAPHVISETLENAVKMAVADAEPGETILLAPACASFDQFDSFEARGDAFAQLVEQLPS